MYRETKQAVYNEGYDDIPVISMKEELQNLADGDKPEDVLARQQDFQFKSGEKPVLDEVAGLMFINRMQAGIDGFQPEYFGNVRNRLGLDINLNKLETTE